MTLKKKGKLTISTLAIASLLFTTHSALANDTISNLKKEKEHLQQDMNNSKKTISDYNKELETVENSIEQQQNELFNLQKKISETDDQISDKETLIASVLKEIEEIQELIETKTIDLELKKGKLEQHIKFMYSGGKVKFLEVLFRSESLMEFVNRYEKYNDIAKQARILHDEIVTEIEYIEEQKKKLEDKKQTLENEKANLESIKKKQLEQKTKHDELLKELEAKEEHIHEKVDAEKNAMNEIMDELKSMEDKIRKEQARIEEEKRKAEQQRLLLQQQQQQEQQQNSNNDSSSSTPSNSVTDGLGNGTLASPMKKGTYYISSHYGYRSDPFTGARTLHNGTDFAAPLGTPIYAMEDGFVLFSGPARGYGNWIVIKHDNGLYTGYGHMYSNYLYVSAGQRVSRGQKIAGVGSAGDSTGNHLHFFVSTTGPYSGFSYKNALNYIQR